MGRCRKHSWYYYSCSFGFWKRCWNCSDVRRSTRKKVEEAIAAEMAGPQ